VVVSLEEPRDLMLFPRGDSASRSFRNAAVSINGRRELAAGASDTGMGAFPAGEGSFFLAMREARIPLPGRTESVVP
jgi:hypothetical protein